MKKIYFQPVTQVVNIGSQHVMVNGSYNGGGKGQGDPQIDPNADDSDEDNRVKGEWEIDW